ncbi:MAG: chemotaxis protein CheW [Rhodocyclaceae bacterium]|jgi:twitching motility protein PilI|nr:chemotaxis protein CheW [Rhodocyclaceae bacterium]MDO9602010.1 chemotaxis protein CheW [Rhodocyclaceae bacterium]MDP2107749.1 chemotaxis protein CheW [Rhodocyclaceae bacterium]MDP2195762.1 chemotaxis protein CheW [Rhodocyclaceae bacterium]MDP3036112.1 chemotaxis protein CheW [Rhodocyclaceae bacterium]
MAKRVSLREFQAGLAERLSSARRGQAAQALLGAVAGKEHYLLELSDSGEVVPLPPLTTVPLTKPWFAGVANVRGELYSVVDFSAYQGGEATPRNSAARLLLVGARYGINSALLVNRTLGLRSLAGMQETAAADNSAAWFGTRYVDDTGQAWVRLRLRPLLEDPEFLNVASS